MNDTRAEVKFQETLYIPYVKICYGKKNTWIGGQLGSSSELRKFPKLDIQEDWAKP